ncbi:MAG: putative transport system ATP-binding protein [Frankiales bacterium]|nr:putative transport system ATP-binding protein [Frankiales bacterium]
MSALVTAEELGIEYAGRVVLSSVSLTVNRGDVLAVTGRSGSGKTTLLLALAGLLKPSAGTVQLDGGRVLYVPQAPSLIPELTALENVMLAMRLHGADPDQAEERSRAELAALGVADAADALPSELSGGMAQRTSLARGLALDPAVLLVDEPTGSLDRATGARVLGLLAARAREGFALVIATHDPEVAARAHRVLHLDDGRLEEAA